jgi:hypothetical protein
MLSLQKKLNFSLLLLNSNYNSVRADHSKKAAASVLFPSQNIRLTKADILHTNPGLPFLSKGEKLV